MKALSMFFYFFGHHGVWAFLVLILIGIGLFTWRKNYIYMPICFALAIANVFAGQFANAWFLATFGERGTGVITASEQTNSTLNDEYIWDYDAVVQTKEGKDVVTSFSTTTASTYPIRNAILIPPDGERFVVKYIPGFERNIVIMVDESAYGKRFLSFENLKPVQKARRQYEASPDNKFFREEYLKALQNFVNDPVNAADTLNLYQSREIIRSLNEN